MKAVAVIFSRLLFASAAAVSFTLGLKEVSDAVGQTGQLTVHFLLPLFFTSICVFLCFAAGRIASSSRCLTGRIGHGLLLTVAFAALLGAALQAFHPGAEPLLWGQIYGLSLCGTVLLLFARLRRGETADRENGVWMETAAAVVGCMVVGLLQWLSQASPSQPNHLDMGLTWTVELQNSGAISLKSEVSDVLPLIGSESSVHTTYAAIDYRDKRSRDLCRELKSIQEEFGECLSIVLLPVGEDDESLGIHRTLMALRKADPSFYDEIESRLLNGRIAVTQSAVVDAAVRLAGAERFQLVYRHYIDAIDSAIADVARKLESNPIEAQGSGPRFFAGNKLLVGFDGAAGVKDHIASALRLPPLSEVPFRPVLSLESATIDLGELAPGQTVPVPIAFENTGNEPLTIGLIKGGPGTRVEQLPNEAIPPGEESSLLVQIRAGRPGEALRDILIGSNDGSGYRRVHLRGYVTNGNSGYQPNFTKQNPVRP